MKDSGATFSKFLQEDWHHSELLNHAVLGKIAAFKNGDEDSRSDNDDKDSDSLASDDDEASIVISPTNSGLRHEKFTAFLQQNQALMDKLRRTNEQAYRALISENKQLLRHLRLQNGSFALKYGKNNMQRIPI